MVYVLKKLLNASQKKIAQTDAIFSHVHTANRVADETEGVIRISIDTKANVNLGPFSQGGYSRQGVKACDHDFNPDTVLKPFGIYLPAFDQNYFYFTNSNVTPDFMIDALEDLWPIIKARFNPHPIAINTDNGPENNSRRSQFMKRLVDFAIKNPVSISLIYYPPYHSKYNPIERVWAVLENHWRGQVLSSVEKTLGIARTMKWNGNNPVVKFIKGTYDKGIKLTQKAIRQIEKKDPKNNRHRKRSVDIPCY